MRRWFPESVFARFFLFGLVVVAWGFGLNIFLNEGLHLYRPAAYALVVASQMVIGFLLNRYCVFDSARAALVSQFVQYLSALALFRGIDWGLYAVQVELFSVPYLLAQGINTVFIFLSKFFTYKRIFKGPSSGVSREDAAEMTSRAHVVSHVQVPEAGVDPNLIYHAAQAHMSLLPNYYRWLFSHFRKYISGTVIELGCGSGHMIGLYASLAERVIAVDVNPVCLNTVRQAYSAFDVQVVEADLSGDWGELEGLEADVVVALDLLEHMEDEHIFFNRMRSCVKPGGRVVLKVPAQRRLFSEMDRASGHFRRYDEADLAALMASEGFCTRRLRALNPIGAFVYRLRRHRPANFSRTFSPAQLKVINWGMNVLPFFDGMPGLKGLSLIGVFERPASEPDVRS